MCDIIKYYKLTISAFTVVSAMLLVTAFPFVSVFAQDLNTTFSKDAPSPNTPLVPEKDPTEKLRELEAQEKSLEEKLSGSLIVPAQEQDPAGKLPVEEAIASKKVEPTSKASEKAPSKAVSEKAPASRKPLKEEEASPIMKAVDGVREATEAVRKENVDLRSKYTASQKTLSSLQERCSTAEKRASTLEKQYAESQASVQNLAKALDETKSRLMIAETEVERLSARLQGSPSKASQPGENRPSVSDHTADPDMSPMDLQAMPGRTSQDMPLATVTMDSANIRTGPGPQYSTLMTISRGTSLAVESRQGEWLRVITPMGARAWINSSAVRVGVLSRNLGNSSTRQQSTSASSEDKEEAAIATLNQALKKQTN